MKTWNYQKHEKLKNISNLWIEIAILGSSWIKFARHRRFPVESLCIAEKNEYKKIQVEKRLKNALDTANKIQSWISTNMWKIISLSLQKGHDWDTYVKRWCTTTCETMVPRSILHRSSPILFTVGRFCISCHVGWLESVSRSCHLHPKMGYSVFVNSKYWLQVYIPND